MKFLVTVTRIYGKEIEAKDETEACKLAGEWKPTDEDMDEETIEVEQ